MKIKAFLKETRWASRILFILWIATTIIFVCSVLINAIQKLTWEIFALPLFFLALLFLMPAIVIEWCHNSTLNAGWKKESRFVAVAFIKKTTTISKILFFFWLGLNFFSVSGLFSGMFSFGFPFFFAIVIIESVKNPVLAERRTQITDKRVCPSEHAKSVSPYYGVHLSANEITALENKELLPKVIGLPIMLGSGETAVYHTNAAIIGRRGQEHFGEMAITTHRVVFFRGEKGFDFRINKITLFSSSYKHITIQSGRSVIKVALPAPHLAKIAFDGIATNSIPLATAAEDYRPYAHGRANANCLRTAEMTIYVSDEIFEDAVDIVMAYNDASVAILKRELDIGYNRSARLIAEMENVGIIGSYDGVSPRPIIMSAQKWNDMRKNLVVDTFANKQYLDEEHDIANVASIDGMEGHAFEHFCANLLGKKGFSEIRVTPGSGDQGVDILAVKDGICYAIQCKNYSAPLGNTPVQEVNAGKIFYNCHVGVVMTNSTFTSGAKALAKATGVLLWDRTYVQNLMKE